MLDKLFEQFSELKLELMKLDNAYVVGNPFLTLTNLGYPINQMSEQEQIENYIKVAKRIYEIQSLLNQDNCQ